MLFNELISDAVKLQLLNTEDALQAANYPLSGNYIDVSQYERFAFLVGAGSLDSILTCQVKQADAVNGTAKSITDAVVVIPADGDDKWYMVEVQTEELDINSDYRYVTLAISGPTGNDYGCVWFLGYNPGFRPVTQGADCGEVVKLLG